LSESNQPKLKLLERKDENKGLPCARRSIEAIATALKPATNRKLAFTSKQRRKQDEPSA